jgi:hypothetical protein
VHGAHPVPDAKAVQVLVAALGPAMLESAGMPMSITHVPARARADFNHGAYERTLDFLANELETAD